MASIQFYLIISFFSLSLYNSKVLKGKETIIQLCGIFFIFTFSYEKLLYIFSFSNNFLLLINKIIVLIQSLCILCVIYFLHKLYKDLQKNIRNIIIYENQISKIYFFILGSPPSCLTLLSFYYTLNIIAAFINNPIILIYVNIVLNILIETTKYFIVFVCYAILWYLNQIKFKTI